MKLDVLPKRYYLLYFVIVSFSRHNKFNKLKLYTSTFLLQGFEGWSDPESVLSIFFYVRKPGTFSASLRLTALLKCKITATFAGGSSEQVEIAVEQSQGNESVVLKLGEFTTAVSKGYVQLNLQGSIVKEEKVDPEEEEEAEDVYFPGLFDFIITSGYKKEEIGFVPTTNLHFGHRGPSTHLHPVIPHGIDIEYFYTEVIAPVGEDPFGTYYMACGIGGGYFGIQRDEKEQTQIFSIWADSKIQKATDIPEAKLVRVVQKAEDTVLVAFGNEGSGSSIRSYHNWDAGKKFKFILRGRPNPTNPKDQKLFSAWYLPEGATEWKFMATLLKPGATGYLTGIYSFLECFDVHKGHLTRRGLYGNQWARDTKGTWHELTGTKFTVDGTGYRGERFDYAGGLDEASGFFFLKLGGFFNGAVGNNALFTRPATGKIPNIDVAKLPNNNA